MRKLRLDQFETQ